MSDGNQAHNVTRPDVLGRILKVTSTFPRWPNDTVPPFCLQLAQDLPELGWHVDVLAPHARGVARREVLDGMTIERFRSAIPEACQRLCYNGGALIQLRRQPSEALLLPSFLTAQCLAVASCIRRRPYDIVHSHWILPQGFTTALVATGRSLPHM